MPIARLTCWTNIIPLEDPRVSHAYFALVGLGDNTEIHIVQKGHWRTEWQAWAMSLPLWMALHDTCKPGLKALMALSCCNPYSQVRGPFLLLPLPLSGVTSMKSCLCAW